jgi:hypothetical protein
MESMHKFVELERIDFATIPAIELLAKLAEGLTQVAIVRDRRPFSDEPFEPFWNFLHRLSGYRSPLSRGGLDSYTDTEMPQAEDRVAAVYFPPKQAKAGGSRWPST